MISHGRMTLQDYLARPETNRIVELIGGECIEHMIYDIHQATLGRVFGYLHHTEKLAMGTLRIAPTGVYFDEEHFYEPDIFWVSPTNTNCFLRPDGHYWQGAPDLVVEVFSLGTMRHDKITKFKWYQKHGVREYWMADPTEEYVEVWRLIDGQFGLIGVFGADETFESQFLVGLPVVVGTFFG
ncbi:MAG: Uma2 family endonuclease [Chitinophagaceae bacterium]|nr:Uma2 family endonuclease [Anaerolineae bacterium]